MKENKSGPNVDCNWRLVCVCGQVPACKDTAAGHCRRVVGELATFTKERLQAGEMLTGILEYAL